MNEPCAYYRKSSGPRLQCSRSVPCNLVKPRPAPTCVPLAADREVRSRTSGDRVVWCVRCSREHRLTGCSSPHCVSHWAALLVVSEEERKRAPRPPRRCFAAFTNKANRQQGQHTICRHRLQGWGGAAGRRENREFRRVLISSLCVGSRARLRRPCGSPQTSDAGATAGAWHPIVRVKVVTQAWGAFLASRMDVTSAML